MLSEMMQVIAEAEGTRTPKRKRSKKELEKIVTDYQTKKASKKKPAAAKAKTPAKKPAVTIVKPKTPPTFIEPIPMNFISPTGFVREAGFDAKNNMFHIAFAKSTWAMPDTAERWQMFEKAVADPTVDIDAFYRKEYRGRTGDMLPVRTTAKTQAVTA